MILGLKRRLAIGLVAPAALAGCSVLADFPAPKDSGPSDASGDATPGPRCGDGVQDPGEECDDANLRSHDGCSSGCTQETLAWRHVVTTNAPSPRAELGMAFDSTRGRVVLFGGATGAALFHDDTWELDGSNWTEMTPLGAPVPERARHGMTFDETRGVTVLFAGWNTSDTFGDTWEYDGVSWVEVSPPGSPQITFSRELAYHSGRGRTVLGLGSDGLTWEYDGANWSGASLAPAPPDRLEHGWSYDSARGTIVLFGGYDNPDELADTWEYDGTWTEATPALSPPARTGVGLAYHAAHGRTILFGGLAGVTTYFDDTFEYDGTGWTALTLTPAPSPRAFHNMVYDSRRRRIVLFGGRTTSALNDTWELLYLSAHPDEICNSGADDDGDGLTDCADPDCDGLACGP